MSIFSLSINLDSLQPQEHQSYAINIKIPVSGSSIKSDDDDYPNKKCRTLRKNGSPSFDLVLWNGKDKRSFNKFSKP